MVLPQLLLVTLMSPTNSAQAQGPETPAYAAGVTIASASACFQLSSPEEGLLLRSVMDTATGTELVPRAGEGLPLWEIVLLDPERKLTAVRATSGATYEFTRPAGGDEISRLRWPSVDLPGEPGALTVEATVVVPAENRALSYWYINVINRSKVWGVWEVRYPRMERLGPIGAREQDLLLDPHTTGRLRANPYQRLDPPKGMLSMGLESGRMVGSEVVREAQERIHYPGYACFQMCALCAPERAGLYYAAYDGNGYYKQFCLGATEDRQAMDLYLKHSPEGQGLPGTGYTSPFPVVVGTFQGDWLTAARIYRQWAKQQVWCARGPLEERTDVAPWFKELAHWEFITANDYGRMHYYQALLGGLPWANHWNYIWGVPGQGDTGSPNLFPPVGGDQQMKEETAKLKAAGIHGIPYFLGSALDWKSPQYTDWNMEAAITRGGEAHYALDDPNIPYTWFYPQTRFAWPCPHLDAWPDRAVEIVRHMMELGAGGVYLDTTTGNGYQCFSKDHGHSVGGGNYWAMGNRRYLKRVRDVVKSVDPDGIMTGENACEIYNDLMDGYLLYNHDNPAAVPAFQAIYHDYVGTYGQFLATAAKIGEDYPWMLPIGISFINGDQFGCTARTDHTMQSAGAADMAWQRRLAHFRVKCVNTYMALGEMVRAPKIENALPEVSGCWKPGAWPVERYGTDTMIRPAVIHSAWKASDGTVGIVFLNISEQPRPVRFTVQGRDFGFAPGRALKVTALSLGPDEKAVQEPCADLAGGVGVVERTMEGRGMWAVEIKVAGNGR